MGAGPSASASGDRNVKPIGFGAEDDGSHGSYDRYMRTVRARFRPFLYDAPTRPTGDGRHGSVKDMAMTGQCGASSDTPASSLAIAFGVIAPVIDAIGDADDRTLAIWARESCKYGRPDLIRAIMATGAVERHADPNDLCDTVAGVVNAAACIGGNQRLSALAKPDGPANVAAWEDDQRRCADIVCARLRMLPGPKLYGPHLREHRNSPAVASICDVVGHLWDVGHLSKPAPGWIGRFHGGPDRLSVLCRRTIEDLVHHGGSWNRCVIGPAMDVLAGTLTPADAQASIPWLTTIVDAHPDMGSHLMRWLAKASAT